MEYSLAKELKDAGFRTPHNPPNQHARGMIAYPGEFKDDIYYPTLSELIEACGYAHYDDFGLSTGYTDQWEAWATYHGEAIPEVNIKVKGSTPEEAVARLWLALNKK